MKVAEGKRGRGGGGQKLLAVKYFCVLSSEQWACPQKGAVCNSLHKWSRKGKICPSQHSLLNFGKNQKVKLSEFLSMKTGQDVQNIKYKAWPARHSRVLQGAGRPCPPGPCLSEFGWDEWSLSSLALFLLASWLIFLTSSGIVCNVESKNLNSCNIGVDHHSVDPFLFQRLDCLLSGWVIVIKMIITKQHHYHGNECDLGARVVKFPSLSNVKTPWSQDKHLV